MKTRSPATTYVLSFSFWMVLYILAIVWNGLYFRNHTPLGLPARPWLYIFAVLPSLPIGGTIHAVLRFMRDSDEYVSKILTRRFVLATGATLFISSAWGFLENYAGVQHFDLYYVYILFWICFGVITPFVREAR